MLILPYDYYYENSQGCMKLILEDYCKHSNSLYPKFFDAVLNDNGDLEVYTDLIKDNYTFKLTGADYVLKREGIKNYSSNDFTFDLHIRFMEYIHNLFKDSNSDFSYQSQINLFKR